MCLILPLMRLTLTWDRSWHDSFANGFNCDGVMNVSLSRSDWLMLSAWGEGVALISASNSSKYDSSVRSSASSASSIVLYLFFTSIRICCLTAAAVRRRNEKELLTIIVIIISIIIIINQLVLDAAVNGGVWTGSCSWTGQNCLKPARLGIRPLPSLPW